MRIADIIRTFLDQLDNLESPDCAMDDEPIGYTDVDLPRLRQIAGLLSDNEMSLLANEPNPKYADIEAVIASGTDLNRSKHPADLRTTQPSLYPGTTWRP